MQLYGIISKDEDNCIVTRQLYRCADDCFPEFREELINEFHYHPDLIEAYSNTELMEWLDLIEEGEFELRCFKYGK